MTSQVANHSERTFARNLRSARKAKGYTQRQLAGLVNDVDSLAVSRWERRGITPNEANLAALCSALDVTVEWLYTDHTAAA